MGAGPVKTPPQSAATAVVESLHGTEVHDPYRWLEAGADPAVQEWSRLQNEYSRSVLDSIPARTSIAQRLAEAMEVGLQSVLVPRGRHRFFTRRGRGMNQVALYVREGDAERLLIDPGPLSADGATALDWWYPSPDGSLVCFGVSEGGDEESVLQFVESASGRVLADRVTRCRLASVAFEPDGRAVLYTREPAPGSVPPDEQMYHRKVWRHVIGTPDAADTAVFGKGRDKLDLPSSISISSSGRWTAIHVSLGWSRSACFLREGSGPFVPFFEGPDQKAHPWFAGERLLALTTVDAPNYRLVEIDPADPAPASWRTLIDEGEHTLLDVSVTSERLLAHHLVAACSRISVYSLAGGFERELQIPALATVTGVGADSGQAAAYLAVETFTQPAVVLEVEPVSGALREVVRLDPPAAFDPDRYPARQVTYRSRDGARVTMFLVGRQQGKGPVLLTGYGGFDISRTPLWSPALVPFWEAGGLFALPNLRGGGEYGERWHRSGMRGAKQNVFDDFIAAAEWLIDDGHCDPGQLGIMGGSNGGLLVGAAMTQRPDLFGAVVCRVPLLDMVRYEQFKVARLWAAEYGSADDEEGFRWLYAYSPYHRVEAGRRYPPTLLTAGEEDTRVDPMHARKMAALLQSVSPSPTLLRIEPRAGHGQGKPVAKLVPEEADVWAFLLDQLG